jgi:methionine-rich copper-binding protein CopC
MMRLTILLLLAMATAASQACAHALLERALPPVGSAITVPPRQIVLTFTEGVEPLFSTIELRGPGGSVVATSKPRSPPGSNRQLVIELPALARGEYTVIWHAASVDTHKTEGSYRFTIR